MITLRHRAFLLLESWCDRLIAQQLPDQFGRGLAGGLLCPECCQIHGRCNDAVYPLIHLYRATKNPKYLAAAQNVMAWAEYVSTPAGAWMNNPIGHAWEGITVFAALSLGETLRLHGQILPEELRRTWRDRFAKAVAYLDSVVDINWGNINYPATACATFAVASIVLDQPRYAERARALSKDVAAYFTATSLLHGEGPRTASTRGRLAIDVGYNVEESLPALALYAELLHDVPMMDRVEALYRVHLEHLLPDGGWDNSWGSRMYKWTYWGSRTSDGCCAGLASLAQRDPIFIEAAARNVDLLARCTHDGLLFGGPDAHHAGRLACNHHAFCHAKAIAAMLDDPHWPEPTGATLPIETLTGVRYLAETDTTFVSVGPWRATFSNGDQAHHRYLMPTGGCLSLLWHESAGPVITASLNHWSTNPEPMNMPDLRGVQPPCLIPRVEIGSGTKSFATHRDHATATVDRTGDTAGATITTRSRLVDQEQTDPPTGRVEVTAVYRFDANQVRIDLIVPAGLFHLPLLCRHDEPVILTGQSATIRNTIFVEVEEGVLQPTASRGWNPVPGFEAAILSIAPSNGRVSLTLRAQDE